MMAVKCEPSARTDLNDQSVNNEWNVGVCYVKR